MDTIYAVSLGAQKPLIDQFCFGTCGKIRIGGIIICGGPFLPCGESKCPHEEATLDDGIVIECGDSEYRAIIRKLSANAEPKQPNAQCTEQRDRSLP
jgi:hypothetical protein